MKPPVRHVLLFASVLLAPQHLTAQFDAVTALFKEVHSITLYGQSAWTNDPAVDGGSACVIFDDVLCGVGTEVLIDVGDRGAWHVELGLGASYLSGLQDKRSDLDLHGAVRSFPTVSAYATQIPLFRSGLAAYLGASVGLADLMNTQTYDAAGREREVKGSTFDYGATAGVYHEFASFGVFLEGSYRWRRFSSLDYTLVETDSGRVPQDWPRSLDFSGPSVAMGVQFRLKEDPPVSPVQVWMLAEVDAVELPAPITATPTADSVTQTQIVFGSLTLTTGNDSSYVLQIVSRRAVLNAEGTVASLPDTAQWHEEKGTFSVGSGRWSLDPDDGRGMDSPAYPISRIGDEFVIRDRATGSALTFRKPGAGAAPGSSNAKKDAGSR